MSRFWISKQGPAVKLGFGLLAAVLGVLGAWVSHDFFMRSVKPWEEQFSRKPETVCAFIECDKPSVGEREVYVITGGELKGRRSITYVAKKSFHLCAEHVRAADAKSWPSTGVPGRTATGILWVVASLGAGVILAGGLLFVIEVYKETNRR